MPNFCVKYNKTNESESEVLSLGLFPSEVKIKE